MFKDWKTILLNDNITQSNLQILIHSPSKSQCLFFFLQKWKIHPKIHKEFQGTRNNQNKIEKEQKLKDPYILISKLMTKLQ